MALNQVRTIETKTAELSTLSVTIKALHVNSKQMTLAVFRQLPEIDPYDDEGRISTAINPWGTVNYEIKKSHPGWLVSEHNGILHRSNLWDEIPSWLQEMRNGPGSLNILKRSLEAFNLWLLLPDRTESWLPKPSPGGRLYKDIPPGWKKSLGHKRYDKSWEFERESDGELIKEDIECVERDISLSANYLKSYKTLSSLPQLFIAV